MDFTISEDIKPIRNMVRSFVQNEVEPNAQIIEDTDEIPKKVMDKAKEIGLFGLSIPAEYGGLGINMLEKCILLEELGKTHNGFTTVIGAHNAIGTVGIVEMGTEEQKKKYLPRMATGEWMGSFALTEPSAGSQASNIKTKAVRKGDKYIINGSKIYITNAKDAKIFTVMAVTDESKGSKGITSFIVEKDFPGFILGNSEKKMGLRGSNTSQLYFENLEVPVENRLGEEGEGYINALKILTNGRAGLAARNLGSSEYLLDMSLDYAMNREQFDQPIFENQAVSHKLADMATQIETLRWMTYRVAWMTDQGMNVIKEAAMAKLYGSEVFNKIADEAVQIHGGMGYMGDYPIERFYRDARIATIYEGSSEIQKNIIGSRLKRDYLKKK